MNKTRKTHTAYNFRNTCNNCFNDIEFPLLGDFAYGEMILQTQDAKDFYVGVLIDNKTLDFITDTLQNNTDFKHKKADPLKILTLIADKTNNKEFTTDYPICPICKSKLRGFDDSIRTSQIELGLATWTDFENLSPENKLRRLQEVINVYL